MLSYYLKVGMRALLKNKVHSGINLAGLAFGLACTIVITLWILREFSVDDFHENKHKIFRVMENQTYSGNEIYTFSATPGPLKDKLKELFPEITHATRLTWDDTELLSVGDKGHYQTGFYADQDFWDIFTCELINGERKTLLAQPDHIVISESVSQKLFGTTDVIGRTLQMQTQEEYRVSGVFKEMPENSTLKFDFIAPVDAYIKRNDWLATWNSNGIRTYLMTQANITSDALGTKIKDVVRQNGQDNVDLRVQAMPEWYLYTDFQNGINTGGGRIESVRIFSIIAVFILLIACINFMNLSTARSSLRALEVGIRKVSGASRFLLSAQFLGESLLLTTCAGVAGIGLASLALPWFNQLFDLKLSLYDAGWRFWSMFAVITLLTGIIAGSYPALFLSGFKPVKVLKGSIRTGSGGGAGTLRKTLVTTQFIISVFLIISTIVIYHQMQLIQHKHLGYDKENLVMLPVNGTLWDKYQTVKTELLQHPEILSISATNGWLHSWGNNTSQVSWQGKDPDQSILFQTIPVEHDFLKTIGATLREGRDFSSAFPGDSLSYVVNETATELMGMENPIGQALTLNEVEGKIVGWVKDFHVGSFKAQQDPVILLLRPWKNWIYVRLAPGDINKSLALMGEVLKKHNPAYPFQYHFTDQEYAELHRAEQVTGSLAKVFAGLAVFVSCLGLFGLAAFSTEQRQKEIGIRKILGATVSNLLTLLSKDFLKLVLIAILIAIPLAWWAMDDWLRSYTFRIELEWWYFALAGVAAIAIAFITVSAQGIRAALINPIHSLRSE